MPDVKFKHVVSCSSEDPKHPSSNLVAQEAFRKWKGIAGQSSISVVLQLEKSSKVRALDIGNDFSAFIEVLVGRSTDKEDSYHVLLPAASFMNPNESRAEKNGARVRMFASDDLVESTMAQSWDRIKVICQQPFNKQLAFGLAFIRVIEGKSETAQMASGSHETSTSVLQPQNQLTMGRFALRDEPNADIGSLLSPGAMFKKKQTSKGSIEEDCISSPAIRNAPQHKPSTPSTFVELSSKRKKSPPPRPKRQASSDGASSSAAKVPRHKSPSRMTPKADDDRKPKAPLQPSVSTATVPSPPVTPKVVPKAVKQLKRVPFDQLLSGVTFALSGFVNPMRAELREKALELGGKYRPDWQPGCTHLICAFANTPKFNQVRGRGKIVKKDWIEDCHSRRRRLPWRRYALDRADQGRPESEDELEADNASAAPSSAPRAQLAAGKTAPVGDRSNSKSPSPVSEKPVTLRSRRKDDPDFDPDVADGSSTTDVDSEASNTDDEIDQIRAGKKVKKLPNRRERERKNNGGQTSAKAESPTKLNVDANGFPLLPDFLAGKHFFIFGKMLSADERRQVNRYVTAFGGVLEQYMDHKVVTVVVTKNEWDENFDRVLTENPTLVFVKPQWIIDCGRQEKLLPIEPFVIEKS